MANNIILPFSELQAELNDEAMIDPNAVIDITENGLYNVAKYGYANVNVEGGGGSSDFSTAQVTMSSVNFMPLPYIKDGDLVYEYPEEVGVYEVPIPSNGGTIITLDRNIPIIATGSATVVNNEKAQTTIVTITGDCTLTVAD